MDELESKQVGGNFGVLGPLVRMDSKPFVWAGERPHPVNYPLRFSGLESKRVSVTMTLEVQKKDKTPRHAVLPSLLLFSLCPGFGENLEGIVVLGLQKGPLPLLTLTVWGGQCVGVVMP